jgi:S1-C subfamily serine protease
MAAGPHPEERIVISQVDLARQDHDASIDVALPTRIPWWARVIGWALALSFPLLAIFAFSMRLSIRRNDPLQREAWKGFLCTLLIVSGATNLGALAWFSIYHHHELVPRKETSTAPILHEGLEIMEQFPGFPTTEGMTSVEIAARTRPLVFIVTPDINIDPRHDAFGIAQIGAGVLLQADEEGFLIATNRHVVEPARSLSIGTRVGEAMVISAQWQYALGRIAATHRSLDLALLWVPRSSGSSRFHQQIAPYGSIPLGDPIYVVGHPQRLYFTLSNGLISRLDNGTLQLSAPISPGNSGGPVYDARGNLLGIVTSKLDREITPNAENLNFATRADALLENAGWDFGDQGEQRLRRFISAQAIPAGTGH